MLEGPAVEMVTEKPPLDSSGPANLADLLMETTEL